MTDDYTVGVVAEMTGVSVRTLHHYDQIGLVRPSSRSPAGYRLYTEADVRLLQRVLFYRELDLDLGDIAEVVSNPEITDEGHLRRQRELVEQRITRSQAMQDWLKLRDELHAIHRGLADAMARGVPATDPAVMDLAEELRRHTDRWFHDCGYDKHRELAELYRTNQRSGRNYDDMAPGLSQYVHDAIMANCDRAGP